jgi:hypothetical protein
MSKRPKITHDLKKISISYMCSKTNKVYTVKVTEHEIKTSSGECDLCGEHGHVSIEIKKCPGCGKYEWIELKSW